MSTRLKRAEDSDLGDLRPRAAGRHNLCRARLTTNAQKAGVDDQHPMDCGCDRPGSRCRPGAEIRTQAQKSPEVGKSTNHEAVAGEV